MFEDLYVPAPKRRKRRNHATNYTDYQILTLIKSNPGISVYELYQLAVKIKLKGFNNERSHILYHKVLNSVNRLEGEKERIRSEKVFDGVKVCKRLYPILV
jgi:hypothetical protein